MRLRKVALLLIESRLSLPYRAVLHECQSWCYNWCIINRIILLCTYTSTVSFLLPVNHRHYRWERAGRCAGINGYRQITRIILLTTLTVHKWPLVNCEARRFCPDNVVSLVRTGTYSGYILIVCGHLDRSMTCIIRKIDTNYDSHWQIRSRRQKTPDIPIHI